jgi:transcription initiation factor IIE alpha subunit
MENYKSEARKRAIKLGHSEPALLDKLDALKVISELFDTEHIAELLAIYFTDSMFHNMSGVKEMAYQLNSRSMKERAKQLDEIVNKKCNHLDHNLTNHFIGQTPVDENGEYTMHFKCAKCGNEFESVNDLAGGLKSIKTL